MGMRFPASALSVLMVLGAPRLGAAPPTAAERDFTLFETGQVRPLATSPDRKHLFAANTPDNRLEVFRINRRGLKHVDSVAVGLEPIAVAARSNDEVWVVNHLSDSVSIVDVSNPSSRRVVRTLLVGDEPRDIVFAGPRRARAFITTAHRGQNSPVDPQLTTPGVGRADVWVFESEELGDSLGGTPLAILTLFCDTPRALAASPDGSRVYAAAFHSGNRTTTIFEELIPNGGEAAGGLPGPRVDSAGEAQPETGLVVKFDGTHWVDALGRVWDHHARFSLPDRDVFAIDALADPPVEVEAFAGVGTVIFNLAVNPASGRVYATNTDANNLTRFEGPGGGGSTVRGNLARSRITVLGPSGVEPRHLNKHIDFSQCCDPIPNAENARSLAQPLEMAVTADGRRLYVAAFGSQKVGVFDTAELEEDTFQPDAGSHIPLSGGGPTGLVLDEPRGRLYVLTRFDNSISVIDSRSLRETSHLSMHNPEPLSVVGGRRFLYDASFTSSHGDSSCASCHIFGDFDSLAWDLGDPDGATILNPGPFLLGPTIDFPQGFTATLNPHFRALKGPMTTQSLRGMANHGAMHWRGDRTGGNDEPSAQPDSGSFSEDLAFKKFNVAFMGLNGRHAMLAEEEMQAFTDFILQVTYPPNPIRALDNSLTARQRAGREAYFGERSDTFFNCNGCHVLDPAGNREFGILRPGFLGSDGRFTFENEPQFFKVPHLRNLYQKVGMFGMAAAPLFAPLGERGFTGPQVRGFGFLHDGSVDTLFSFHSAVVFLRRRPQQLSPLDPGNPGGFPFVPPGTPGVPPEVIPAINAQGVQLRRDLEQFMLAFDSNLAPIVGQQVTLDGGNGEVAGPRIDLLLARAEAGECEVVARGRRGAGYLYLGGGVFASDRSGEPLLTDAEIRNRARKRGGEITYTAAPPGSGRRIGIDRDRDGFPDGDEIEAGSDPADPDSVPCAR